MSWDGRDDITAAAAGLALRLPEPLTPLAELAYNYWWSWAPDGPALFQSLDPHRWNLCNGNPVQLLDDISVPRLQALAADSALAAQIGAITTRFRADQARPAAPGFDGSDAPAAYFCAEFGVHDSLPIYAGGLGVLAGDMLKEASDQAVPLVGVGLLYAQGSFHQRLDATGWQHEYWTAVDPDRLPMARVRDEHGHALTIQVPIRGRTVLAQVWRVDVGRVPLFLLDSNLPDNSVLDRWITGRLYIGDQETRLAQYALLGIGGLRALRTMGIAPARIHLNEGHAALAALDLFGVAHAAEKPMNASLEFVRGRTIFTTHTPVAAGNDWFPPEAVRETLAGLPEQIGVGWDDLFRLGRTHPDDAAAWFGLTPFALRTSRAANGVSHRHGEVARGMWRDLWPDRPADAIPIGQVTNGVHLPTWMAPAMQRLLDQHLPSGWRRASRWDGIEAIPDTALWAVRNQLRSGLVAFVRERSVTDRLGREQSTAYAQAAAATWHVDTLTIGFARRIATYKRLYLLSIDPERGLRLLQGPFPVQLAIAGKAHPRDEEAKRTVQQIFTLSDFGNAGSHVVFLEDYDLTMAARLVQGCDLWVNLPRPPLEASGTSGMKSMLNGGLQVSVLDGWWAEAYDGTNGWAIPAGEALDAAAQDARDAAQLLELLEREVLPLFYARDADDVPADWIRRIKRSLSTLGPRFTATRMLHDYCGGVFAPAQDPAGPA
jgi:starch phosphorylase